MVMQRTKATTKQWTPKKLGQHKGAPLTIKSGSQVNLCKHPDNTYSIDKILYNGTQILLGPFNGQLMCEFLDWLEAEERK